MNIVVKPLNEQASGAALPTSYILPLIATESGLTEADAGKLQEFLAASKNEIVTIVRSPLPKDEQIEKGERKGKNTLRIEDGKQVGVDNSQKVVSRTQVYARAEETLPFGDTSFDDNSRFKMTFSIAQKSVVDPSAEEA